MNLQRFIFVPVFLCLTLQLFGQISKGDFSGIWKTQMVWQNDQLLFNKQLSFDFMLGKRMSLGTALGTHYFQRENLRSQTNSFAPRLRYFLSNPSSKFQFYVEGGVGFSSRYYAGESNPYRSTERFFTGNLGVGSFFFIRPDLVLNSSLKYQFAEEIFQNSSVEWNASLLPYFGTSTNNPEEQLGELKKGSKVLNGSLTFVANEVLSDFQASFEYGHFISNQWSIGAEVDLFAPGISNFAAQTNLTTRYFFAPEHKRIDPYLFTKAGILSDLETTPLFQWKAGVGTNIRLTDLIILDLQAGYSQRPGQNTGNFEMNVGTKIMLQK